MNVPRNIQRSYTQFNGLSGDPWAQSFWPQQLSAGQEYERVRILQEMATANAQRQAALIQQELSIRQWAEEKRQKEKERRDLFGEELFALMEETDRLVASMS